jgi:hypothetical protein
VRKTPRDLDMALMGERGAGDAARFEVVQQGTVVDNTN